MWKRAVMLWAVLCSVTFIAAAEPLPPVKSVQIKFPDNPAPRPDPQPVAPAPVEPEVLKVGKSQFYVIAATKPLVILRDGAGRVDLSTRKPPFMLPIDSVVGWPATKDDPDFVHWDAAYPYLYVLKPAKAGAVRLTVIPAVNETGTDGKQVPLTAADVLFRDLKVSDGDTPAPTPTPEPTPDPGYGTNPFGGQPGLRVMIVYESSTVKNLPVGQYLTINGAAFREFVDKNCVADGYRILDPDVKIVDDASALWGNALKRTDRKSLPWLYVGKEGAGYSGPLGADVAGTIAIINKVMGK